MSQQPAQTDHYATYHEFLHHDPRRQGNALEFGHNWRDDHGHRYRVCWYEQTGELTAEQLSATEPLESEDFYRGVAGPVEIIARVTTRDRIDQLIGPWPHTPPGARTLTRLRQLAHP